MATKTRGDYRYVVVNEFNDWAYLEYSHTFTTPAIAKREMNRAYKYGREWNHRPDLQGKWRPPVVGGWIERAIGWEKIDV